MAERVVFSRWRQAHARRPEIRLAERDGVERVGGERGRPQGGKLLIFTGIRYERLDAAPTVKGNRLLEQNSTGLELLLLLAPFQRRADDLRQEKARRLRKALPRSEEHTSDLQSLMRTSYAVSCLNT